ncbi:hypothetical protein RB653_005684 [Dictyostelium firmibasis]|uniref:Uncharacterized protein n=1 Tax=Dictyostelium firmibasis TaxID=79012 RepID=A0AAN7Z1C3_9MYCE
MRILDKVFKKKKENNKFPSILPFDPKGKYNNNYGYLNIVSIFQVKDLTPEQAEYKDYLKKNYYRQSRANDDSAASKFEKMFWMVWRNKYIKGIILFELRKLYRGNPRCFFFEKHWRILINNRKKEILSNLVSKENNLNLENNDTKTLQIKKGNSSIMESIKSFELNPNLKDYESLVDYPIDYEKILRYNIKFFYQIDSNGNDVLNIYLLHRTNTQFRDDFKIFKKLVGLKILETDKKEGMDHPVFFAIQNKTIPVQLINELYAHNIIRHIPGILPHVLPICVENQRFDIIKLFMVHCITENNCYLKVARLIKEKYPLNKEENDFYDTMTKIILVTHKYDPTEEDKITYPHTNSLIRLFMTYQQIKGNVSIEYINSKLTRKCIDISACGLLREILFHANFKIDDYMYRSDLTEVQKESISKLKLFSPTDVIIKDTSEISRETTIYTGLLNQTINYKQITRGVTITCINFFRSTAIKNILLNIANYNSTKKTFMPKFLGYYFEGVSFYSVYEPFDPSNDSITDSMHEIIQ